MKKKILIKLFIVFTIVFSALILPSANRVSAEEQIKEFPAIDMNGDTIFDSIGRFKPCIGSMKDTHFKYEYFRTFIDEDGEYEVGDFVESKLILKENIPIEIFNDENFLSDKFYYGVKNGLWRKTEVVRTNRLVKIYWYFTRKDVVKIDSSLAIGKNVYYGTYIYFNLDGIEYDKILKMEVKGVYYSSWMDWAFNNERYLYKEIKYGEYSNIVEWPNIFTNETVSNIEFGEWKFKDTSKIYHNRLFVDNFKTGLYKMNPESEIMLCEYLNDEVLYTDIISISIPDDDAKDISSGFNFKEEFKNFMNRIKDFFKKLFNSFIRLSFVKPILIIGLIILVLVIILKLGILINNYQKSKNKKE